MVTCVQAVAANQAVAVGERPVSCPNNIKVVLSGQVAGYAPTAVGRDGLGRVGGRSRESVGNLRDGRGLVSDEPEVRVGGLECVVTGGCCRVSHREHLEAVPDGVSTV